MTQLIHIEPQPNAPIVCDFANAPDTPEERLDEYSRLFQAALIDRGRTADGMILTFANHDGVADWVTDLVKREALCCSFLRFEVIADDSAVRWVTSGTPEMQPMLDELYELSDVTGPSPQATREAFIPVAIPLVDRSRE